MLRLLRLLQLLAKFSFADGRNAIVFPDGSVRRASERRYELARRERVERKHAQQKKKAKDIKKAVADGRKDWETLLRTVPRGDID